MSTVLDVAVCLLLVGTALATLAAAPSTPAPEGPNADAPARTIATATTGIQVDNRTRHVTLAAHLGSAAVGAATVDGRRLLGASYPGAVTDATENATGDRVYVTATWEPYPNASIHGRLTAGPKPPASADVAATTLTVDSGMLSDVPDDPGSFRALGRSLGDAVVRWFFPPSRTRAALVDPRTAPGATGRYRSVADTLGIEVDPAVADANATAANDVVAAALADRFGANLRTRYATPEAAAAETSVGDVTIVVRRWDP